MKKLKFPDWVGPIAVGLGIVFIHVLPEIAKIFDEGNPLLFMFIGAALIAVGTLAVISAIKDQK